MVSTSLPDSFGKYAVTALLGEGAMGVVYKGFDPSIGRLVAIKTIRRLPAGDNRDVLADRFVNEARAVGRLNHPGIVAIYELGQQEDTAFIVMEYVEGQDLASMLEAKQNISEALLLALMSQLLEALEYAHARGVWHRDIKPANLIVTTDGQLKVTDFGIARIESAAITQVTSTIGTPGYMAPEQYVGEKFDHRVDLFAAGVLLYRMLSGKAPFTGSSETVMYNIMNTQAQPLHELLSPELAAFYEPVIARALAKKPEDRFASAAAFRTALMQRQPQAGAFADDATVLLGSASLPSSASFLRPTAVSQLNALSSGPALPNDWNADVLAPVQVALFRCMGPLAKVILRNTAKRCSDVPTLVKLLTQQLNTDDEKAQFLDLLNRQEHKSAAASDARTTSSRSGAAYGVTGAEYERLNDTAKLVMVKYMGPIGNIVVKRAAAKARTPEHFMELLAQELPGELERTTFLNEVQAGLSAHMPAPNGAYKS
jgi:serine/threonine-protein kinase